MVRFKRRPYKIPINARYLGLNTYFLTALMLFLPAYTQAVTPLTEAQAVEKVLQQTSIQNWIKGTINEAQSDVEKFSHWDTIRLFPICWTLLIYESKMQPSRLI